MAYQILILVTPSWLVLFAVLVITWLYINTRRPPGMPPGPFPYPITGSMFALIGDIPSHKTFKQISEKYGNVFSIKLGSYWAVVVNNYELVQEVLLTKPNDFSGRPLSFINDWFTDGKQDIAMAQPTPIWKYHRMLAHSSIRQFASGEYLEKLSEQTRPILKEVMAKQLEGPFDPTDVIGFAVYNVIASMCYGHRYNVDDPRLEKIVKTSTNVIKGFGNGWTADFLPWFRFLPNPYFYQFKKYADHFYSVILKEVELHVKNFDSDRPAKDLIELLLKTQEEAEVDGSVDAKNRLTNQHMKHIIADLFLAGIDSQKTTLLWGIACLVDNPEVQDNIKIEIDNVLGGRQPKLSDRGKLPYTEATIMEIMRFRTVLPLAVPHMALVDTTIGSYQIPASTLLFINTWALHNDQMYWDSPEEFRPERFLDSSYSVKQRLPSFLPFSTGRRVCVGETLAKANIFLIFVWMVQNYKFNKPEEIRGPVAVHDKPGLLDIPKPYTIIAKPRTTMCPN